VLNHTQIADFHRDGFVVVEDFIDAASRDALRERALQLVDEWQPTSDASSSVFTTDEQERASTREFLDSGDGIWCFFEPGALDADGAVTRPRHLAINKIGHAMHDLDPVFSAISYRPGLAEVAADIGLVDPVALQSMYIFKQPGIGGEVGCHQDATFLYTEPISVKGFWFAIEDATIDNGCLWAAPGAHRSGLRQLFERTELAGGRAATDAADRDQDPGGDAPGLTRFRELDPTPLPAPPDDLVPLEVPAGTLVVLDGLLPHWSDVNRSDTSRHAYTLHCISASAQYPSWNWLQRSTPLRRLGAAA
jgi:phytanoyl-CoA hydroxylase